MWHELRHISDLSMTCLWPSVTLLCPMTRHWPLPLLQLLSFQCAAPQWPGGRPPRGGAYSLTPGSYQRPERQFWRVRPGGSLCGRWSVITLRSHKERVPGTAVSRRERVQRTEREERRGKENEQDFLQPWVFVAACDCWRERVGGGGTRAGSRGAHLPRMSEGFVYLEWERVHLPRMRERFVYLD